MANPAGSFVWYELMTNDPAAAKQFYDGVVGWNIEAEPSGELDYRMITRSDGGNAGGLMRLTAEMRDGGARPIWMGYLTVDDVDRTLAAIEAEGGRAVMPAFDAPGVGRIAMVADPQGAPMYLIKPTPPDGQPDAVSDVFDPMAAGHVRWNELAASDPDAAIDYYRRHFGWGQDGEMDMGELGKYRFLQHGDVAIGAVMPLMPGMPHPVWNYYFGVDDIDRGAAAVTAGGGTIVQQPMQIPGGEYALNAFDPQGAAFGLVGPRPQGEKR